MRAPSTVSHTKGKKGRTRERGRERARESERKGEREKKSEGCKGDWKHWNVIIEYELEESLLTTKPFHASSELIMAHDDARDLRRE